MKLLVLSDLHLEMAPYTAPVRVLQECDAVVLAGDIHKGCHALAWARQTFGDLPVLYVAGNHEFYGHRWDKLLDQLRVQARSLDIHFLENTAVQLQGIRFLGCTLWTDFAYFGSAKRDAMGLRVQKALNDYRLITFRDTDTWGSGNSPALDMPTGPEVSRGNSSERLRSLRWMDSLARHEESAAWLQKELDQGDPAYTVVITHHYPHPMSTAPRYRHDEVTAGFGSDLGHLMGKSALWIHGHTHDSCDYEMSGAEMTGGEAGTGLATRVVCNPRGYPMYGRGERFENEKFRPGLVVEVKGGSG